MKSPTFRRTALAATMVLLGLTNAHAADAGRYQVVPLARPNEAGSSALIIDSQTGAVWKWFEGTSGTQTGSNIRYEGLAVPGTPGEIVARQGFGQPAMQRQPAAGK